MPLALIMFMSTTQLTPGDHTRSIEVDNRTRTYLVHVPPNPKKPTPVVPAFHGGGSNAQQMVRFCGLNEIADKHGFIVVYPSGSGRLKNALTWNGGNCCGYAVKQKVDDVAFTRAVLDDLEKVVKVDAKRVYATGMSNGAIIAAMRSERSEAKRWQARWGPRRAYWASPSAGVPRMTVAGRTACCSRVPPNCCFPLARISAASRNEE